jgi:hypothetical protein
VHRKNLNLYELPTDDPSYTSAAGRSARKFLDWAQNNPRSLCESLGLAQVSSVLPGGILVYDGQDCGMDKRNGHIEVVVRDNRVCSDHCRWRDFERCKPKMILAPVLSC